MQTIEQREKEGERSRGRENAPKSSWLQDTVKAEKKKGRKTETTPTSLTFLWAWSPTSQIGIEGCGKEDCGFQEKKQVSRKNNHKVWSTYMIVKHPTWEKDIIRTRDTHRMQKHYAVWGTEKVRTFV